MKDLDSMLVTTFADFAMEAPDGAGLLASVARRRKRYAVRRAATLGAGVCGLAVATAALIPLMEHDSLVASTAAASSPPYCAPNLTTVNGPLSKALAADLATVIEPGQEVVVAAETSACVDADRPPLDEHRQVDPSVVVALRAGDPGNVTSVRRSRFSPAFTRDEVLAGAGHPPGVDQLAAERPVAEGRILVFVGNSGRWAVGISDDGRLIQVDDAGRSRDVEELINIAARALATYPGSR